MRWSSVSMRGFRASRVQSAPLFFVLVPTLVVIVRGWSLNTLQRDGIVRSTQLQSRGKCFGTDMTSLWRLNSPLFLSADSTEAGTSEEDLSAISKEVAGMRLSEIKAELKERKVNFSDCFDKESMVSKLANARINNIHDDNSSNDGDGDDSEEKTGQTKGEFDREAALEELKGMRVRELREELGRRRISRAGLFEKEDLVNALLEARAVASVFSATSLLTPGEVADLPEKDVRKEIDHPGSLLLLDVYATWCGPCQMIAPFLKEIAAEQGDQLRIIKMDSDKYPKLSSELKVQGLPTLVLFQGGNEINRIEGAPTKEQLMGWIDSHR